MAVEMKINEKFMVIYGNLCSPKAKIFVSAVGHYYSCRLRTTFFSSVATRPSSNKFDLALAAPSVREIRVHYYPYQRV